MDINSLIYNIAVWAIPVLFAITIHEVAHGWVANKLGDQTAKMLGRLTLNPIKHIDPIGTVAVPLAMVALSTGFVFGWAKPVPVNTRNLKSPRKDMAIVAAAGPISNLIMAVLWVFIFKLGASIIPDPAIAQGIMDMGRAGIVINLILFIFNLFPIPPLDGSKVLSGFLPRPLANLMDKIEPYGLFIVLGLVYFGVLNTVMQPTLNFFMNTIGSLFF